MISITDVAYVLGMDSARLTRWYKEVLSGFKQKAESGELRKDDIKIRSQSEQSIRVPVLEKNNIGQFIAIDEKHIDGHYYTILSNLETSKVIMCIKSVKSKEIYAAISEHFTNEQMFNVLIVTKDGSDVFDWVARQAFPKAVRVMDKFHVINNLLNCMDDVRIYLKHKYVIDLQKQQEDLDKKYIVAIKDAKNKNTSPPPKSMYKVQEVVYSNGETPKLLLHRSKHLLRTHSEKWNEEQKLRAKILFSEFPDLEHLHQILIKFKTWYTIGNLKQDDLKLRSAFDIWVHDLTPFKKYEPINSAILYLKKYKQDILNYFQSGFTNALAESLNRKINTLIYKTFGIRDLDFFFFRLKIYLT
jgi:transposase